MMAEDPGEEVFSVNPKLSTSFHKLDVDLEEDFCTETTANNSRGEKRFKRLTATLLMVDLILAKSGWFNVHSQLMKLKSL